MSNTVVNKNKFDRQNKQDTEAYYTTLINRKRPRKIKKMLLRLVRFERQTSAKINIIEQADKLGIEFLLKLEKEYEEQQSLRFFENVVELQSFLSPFKSVYENKVDLMYNNESTLFQFLLNGYKRILKFKQKTSFIHFKLLNLHYFLSPEFRKFWNVEMRVNFNFLEEPLGLIVKKGWEVLTKIQYNVVIVFYDLLRYYLENKLLIFEDKIDKVLYKKLQKFSIIYFIFNQDKDNARILKEAIGKYIVKNTRLTPILDNLIKALENILDMSNNVRNIPNAITACYIQYYRKYFSMADIMEHLSVFIPNEHFLVSSETKSKIDIFIKQGKEKLKILDQNLQLHYDINFGNKSMDTFFFERLYLLYGQQNKDTETEQGNDYHSVKHLINYDMISFFEKCFSNFLAKIGILKKSKLQTKNNFEVHIIDKSSIKILLSELTEEVQLYNELKHQHIKMTMPYPLYKTFVENKRKPGSFSETEKKYCLKIFSIAELVYTLSGKINNQIVHHSKNSEYSPLQMIVKFEDDDKLEMYKEFTIESVFKGLLTDCFAIAFCLQETNTISLMNNFDSLLSKKAKLLETIERIE